MPRQSRSQRGQERSRGSLRPQGLQRRVDPGADEPAIDQSSDDDLAAEEPILDEPDIDASPSTNLDVAESDFSDSISDEPMISEPEIDEITAEESLFDEPESDEIVVDDQLFGEPEAGEVVGDEPVIIEPKVDEIDAEEPESVEPDATQPAIESPVVSEANSPVRFSSGAATGRGIILGIGGTGVAVVDQALRADHQASPDGFTYLPSTWNVVLADISEELEPIVRSNPAFSSTGTRRALLDQGNMGGEVDIGTSRIPPIGRFIGLQTYKFWAPLRGLNEINCQVAILIHSLGGGTGSGLAPVFADGLRGNAEVDGATSSALVAVSIAVVDTDDLSNIENEPNHIYNFPLMNQKLSMSILLDHKTCVGIEGSTRRKATASYLGAIKRDMGDNLPAYLAEQSITQDYAITDRFAARVARLIAGIPGTSINFGNVPTGLAHGSRFESGKKWMIPYLWPIDRDFDPDSHLPAGHFVMRALTQGGLCEVDPDTQSRVESAIVIYHAPDEFQNAAGNIEADIKRVLNMVRGIDERQVFVMRSPALVPEGSDGGVSMCVLLLGEDPVFIRNWMDRAEKDPEFKQRIKSQGAKWARLDGVNPSDNTLLDLQGRIAHEEEHAWRLIPSSLQRGWGGSIDESVATGSAIEFRKELNDLDIWDALEKCLAGRVQSESD